MLDAPTLWELIEARAEATPDALFAVDDREQTMSFGGYHEAVLRFMASTNKRRGLGGPPCGG